MLGGARFHIACMFVCFGVLRGRALVAFMGFGGLGAACSWGRGVLQVGGRVRL